MPRPPRPFRKEEGPITDLLVVEGSDDFFAFKNLLEVHKSLGKFRLEEGGGYERIRDSIDTRIDESGLERIGFVIDADDNLSDRWASLKSVLINQCDYSQVPNLPAPNGTILRQDGKVTLGIWLMPDNTIPGALEKFISRLVPNGDPLWNYAVNSVNNLPVHSEPVSENWLSKAYVHTWLAWQEEPGKPIGQAITKRYLDARSEAAQPLMRWVQALFDVSL